MSTGTIYYSTTLEAITCGVCAIPFALPTSYLSGLQRDGNQFYCPNGHHISYSDNENKRLRAELATMKQRREFAESRADRLRLERDAEARSRAAIKGHLTRVKKRIANGVCPCCNRSFVNVKSHMDSQHPDYVADLKTKEQATS